MFDRKRVTVVPFGNTWKVACEHCDQTWCFDDKADATRKAREHVANMTAGTLSQITVSGADGMFQDEWTFGADPFPPKG